MREADLAHIAEADGTFANAGRVVNKLLRMLAMRGANSWHSGEMG